MFVLSSRGLLRKESDLEEFILFVNNFKFEFTEFTNYLIKSLIEFIQIRVNNLSDQSEVFQL